jgi:hypothetical protein
MPHWAARTSPWKSTSRRFFDGTLSKSTVFSLAWVAGSLAFHFPDQLDHGLQDAALFRALRCAIRLTSQSSIITANQSSFLACLIASGLPILFQSNKTAGYKRPHDSGSHSVISAEVEGHLGVVVTLVLWLRRCAVNRMR